MATRRDTGTRAARGDTEEYILRSYRYLRLAIVVLLVALGTGLVGQQLISGCIEGSISGYYYTPVHGLFVGSLVATGAAMVALKGRTTVEDCMFNIAGMLAPVVALVPTTREDSMCDGQPALDLARNDLVPISLIALVVAGASILVATAYVAKRNETLRPNARSFMETVGTGVLPLGLLAAGVVGFHLVHGTPWYTGVHFGAAIGLFVAIYCAIASLLFEGFHDVVYLGLTRRRPTEDFPVLDPRYRTKYLLVLILTAVAAVVVLVVFRRTRLFWIEVVGVVSFTTFWIFQTAELWERLPAPPDGDDGDDDGEDDP